MTLKPISTLASLSGTYLNRGEPEGFLSQKLFPDTALEHASIDYIAVAATDRNVTLTALSKQCPVFQKIYFLHRDFEFDGDTIVLLDSFSPFSRGADDPLVGPLHQKIVIATDAEGNGIFKETGEGAGLVFLIIPTAFSATSEIRFRKVSDVAVDKSCENDQPTSTARMLIDPSSNPS